MEKFKKGEIIYTIEGGLILPCTIIKVSTEDRIKDFKSGETSRKKLFKVTSFDHDEEMPSLDHLSRYPTKFAFVRFDNGIEKWKELDSFKKIPGDFINFLD
jgi:hypothetical protein